MFKVLMFMIILFIATISFMFLKHKSNIDNVEPELFPLSVNLHANSQGWEIDYSKLLTPIREAQFRQDTMIELSNSNYACLFYSIIEARMCFYLGQVAIYENKANPKLLFNPKNAWFTCYNEENVTCEQNFVILRMSVLSADAPIWSLPFIVLDLRNKKFAFVPFDITSIYYIPEFIGEMKIRLKLTANVSNENAGKKNRDGEIIDLSKAKYYDFTQADQMLELYSRFKHN